MQLQLDRHVALEFCRFQLQGRQKERIKSCAIENEGRKRTVDKNGWKVCINANAMTTHQLGRWT
jgi:hypothetical protein